MRQYFLMTRAIRLCLLDKARELHAQAWLIQQAKATRQRGKKTEPYFRSFDEFFPCPDDTGPSRGKTRKMEEIDALKAMVLRANSQRGSSDVEKA